MRFKQKVLARFPDARVSVEKRYGWGDPRYVTVYAGQALGSDEEGWDYSGVQKLDIHDSDSTIQQLAAAAWRSAYYWCVRNPEIRLAEAA